MSAKDDLKELKALLDDPAVRAAGKTMWRGEEVTLVELVDLRDKADAATKTEASAKTTEIGRQQAGVRAATATNAAKAKEIRGLESLVENANANLTVAIRRGGDVATAQTNLASLIERLRAVDPQNKLVPQQPVEPEAQMGQAKIGDKPVGTLTLAQTKALAAERGAGPQPAGTTNVTAQNVRVTNTEVTTALKNKGLTDTPANRKTVRDQIKAGKAKPVDENAWIETFNKDYPAYSDWTTDQVVSYFGQDFVDIIKSTVESGVEYSNEELKALLKNTTYFNSVSDKQYKFDTLRDGEQTALIETSKRAIVDEFGDVGLSETDLAEIAKTAARSGLTGTGLKQTVYQYAFRKGGMATAPTSPAMATRALEGSDADAIRKSARAYGYQVSDAEVEAALTGGTYNGLAVSKDSILEKAQKAAKGKYFHLADQIDAGLSLDDIFGTYKKYAATLLEVDENEIDYLSDPKWADAFGSKESGQLSLTDWTQKIKSDAKFGWQYTKQANDQATDIGLTLARAFGKVQ
jgi:hypothetical protein